MVGALLDALPRPIAEIDARLLIKAAGPGRIRDAALTLHAACLAQPRSADGLLRDGLRDARHLHSRERRMVADGLNDLLREGPALEAAIGATGPLARWLGWLVRQGLPVDDARAAWGDRPGDFDAASDLAGALAEEVARRTPAAAAALVGGVSEALGARLVDSLGGEVGAFLQASAIRPAIALRAQGIPPDALAARLADEGVATRPGAWSPSALIVAGRANLLGTRTWSAGVVELQDEGSQLVAEAVDPRGQVVDFCAGAGGKTLALAGHPAVDRLIACDVRPRPLDALQRRAERAGLPRIQTALLAEDGPLPGPLAALAGSMDRVLVDAPCSGSGVLRRHPAYRLRLDAPTLAALPGLQRRILRRAAPLVAPGGRLIYATCSVLSEENDDVVASFLAEHPAFRLTPLAEVLGERAAALGDPYLRVAPHTHGTDGFFAAILTRAA